MRVALVAAIAAAEGTTYGNGDGITVDNDADTISVRLSEDADGANNSGLSFNTDGQLQADPAQVIRSLIDDQGGSTAPVNGQIAFNQGAGIRISASGNSIVISEDAFSFFQLTGGFEYTQGEKVKIQSGTSRGCLLYTSPSPRDS